MLIIILFLISCVITANVDLLVQKPGTVSVYTETKTGEAGWQNCIQREFHNW